MNSTTGSTPRDGEVREAERSASEMVSLALVSLLERRYLNEFDPSMWSISSGAKDAHVPLLREVVSLGRPQSAAAWSRAMPQVLNSSHEVGHAFVSLLFASGERHHVYTGARRIDGAAARSTEDYLVTQEGALKAAFPGLEVGDLRRLDQRGLPALVAFLRNATATAVLTGIPGGHHAAAALDFSTTDRVVAAVGQQRFALMVVAEPLPPKAIDDIVDGLRRLKSEIHAFVRTSKSETTGETRARSSQNAEPSWDNQIPVPLAGLSALLHVLSLGVPVVAPLIGPTHAIMYMASVSRTARPQEPVTQLAHSQQITSDLLDANYEACERLIDRYLERLETARSTGWWQSATYVAAETDRALQAVTGALRSQYSSVAPALEPARAIELAPTVLKSAMLGSRILNLRPLRNEDERARAPLHTKVGETMASFDILGSCLNSGELATIVNLPQRELPGLPLRDYADFGLTAPNATSSSVRIGELQDGLGHSLGPVSLTTSTLNRHVFVTGINGSGKTNTCMQLLIEAYEQLQIPFLVIEPAKTEYRQLLSRPSLRNTLRVFSVGSNSPVPFRLNPFIPIDGVRLGRHIDLLKAVFNASFPMGAGMPYVLEEAILEIYLERGWSLYSSKNVALTERSGLNERSALFPTIEDLHNKIDVVLTRKQYGQEIHKDLGAALRSRLNHLMVGNQGLILNTRRSISPADLFGSPAIIELEELGDDDEKAFVMALVFALLYEFADVRLRSSLPERRDPLRHLTLIEEAHRLLRDTRSIAGPEIGDPRAKSVAMFTDMLAEMRAYGEGFIIADQIPTKLAPETLKNTNVKIVHRLVAPDDRQVTGACMNLDEQQTRFLNNLRPGFAVVHDENIAKAVLVHVEAVKDLPQAVAAPAASPEDAAVKRDRLYLYRQAACKHCQAPCEFYPQLAESSILRELEALVRPLLEAIVLDDSDGVWPLWKRLRASWSARYPLLRDNATRRDLEYCALIAATQSWLGEFLLARESVSLIDSATLLSPEGRLACEELSLAFGGLFVTWLKVDDFLAPAVAAYNNLRRALDLSATASPPIEMPGCAECPTRCWMLPFVAPHLGKLRRFAAQLAASKVTADIRVTKFMQDTAPIRQTIPILSTGARYDSRTKAWLYCAATILSANGAAVEVPTDVLRLLAEGGSLQRVPSIGN